jgi:two-component system, LuxR family, sensor kinase FixL
LPPIQADLIRMTRVSALDEMGSALAHELNQPLTAIMLYLQALEREVHAASVSAKYHARAACGQNCLARQQREAQRAGSIISARSATG